MKPLQGGSDALCKSNHQGKHSGVLPTTWTEEEAWFKDGFVFVYVWVFCLHVCCVLHAWCLQKAEVLDLLEIDLGEIGCEPPELDAGKRRKCSGVPRTCLILAYTVLARRWPQVNFS